VVRAMPSAKQQSCKHAAITICAETVRQWRGNTFTIIGVFYVVRAEAI
jgi:hypothetical protein